MNKDILQRFIDAGMNEEEAESETIRLQGLVIDAFNDPYEHYEEGIKDERELIYDRTQRELEEAQYIIEHAGNPLIIN